MKGRHFWFRKVPQREAPSSCRCTLLKCFLFSQGSSDVSEVIAIQRQQNEISDNLFRAARSPLFPWGMENVPQEWVYHLRAGVTPECNLHKLVGEKGLLKMQSSSLQKEQLVLNSSLMTVK